MKKWWRRTETFPIFSPKQFLFVATGMLLSNVFCSLFLYYWVFITSSDEKKVLFWAPWYHHLNLSFSPLTSLVSDHPTVWPLIPNLQVSVLILNPSNNFHSLDDLLSMNSWYFQSSMMQCPLKCFRPHPLGLTVSTVLVCFLKTYSTHNLCVQSSGCHARSIDFCCCHQSQPEFMDLSLFCLYFLNNSHA